MGPSRTNWWTAVAALVGETTAFIILHSIPLTFYSFEPPTRLNPVAVAAYTLQIGGLQAAQWLDIVPRLAGDPRPHEGWLFGNVVIFAGGYLECLFLAWFIWLFWSRLRRGISLL